MDASTNKRLDNNSATVPMLEKLEELTKRERELSADRAELAAVHGVPLPTDGTLFSYPPIEHRRRRYHAGRVVGLSFGTLVFAAVTTWAVNLEDWPALLVFFLAALTVGFGIGQVADIFIFARTHAGPEMPEAEARVNEIVLASSVLVCIGFAVLLCLRFLPENWVATSLAFVALEAGGFGLAGACKGGEAIVGWLRDNQADSERICQEIEKLKAKLRRCGYEFDAPMRRLREEGHQDTLGGKYADGGDRAPRKTDEPTSRNDSARDTDGDGRLNGGGDGATTEGAHRDSVNVHD
ncbi:MAG: hypothetical protein WA005_10005 [Candidatus Binataceae bacterium]